MAFPVYVKPLKNSVIYLKYSDGMEGEIDLNKTINRNNYDKLKEPSIFSQVYIDEKTRDICWACGVEMCQNALYKQLELIALMKRLKVDINKE